ncbi:carbohydrate ABC transporter permease [Ruania zhangjianzhongii]|uniref:carbohydrate ABC transporter permease n=1 Tax=Ruania zhangjianzhongii TaxID=2603206 RepID=UPI0011C984AC|nr:sugar ABC transporter permease [Ruania zhangjianzhongii]
MVVTAAQAPAAPTPPASQAGPRARAGWLFILPNLVGVTLFTFVPLLSVVVLAFTDWNLVSGLGGIEFIGADNFVNVLQDPTFWGSVGRTVIYAGVSVPMTVVCGLALSLALDRDIPGRGVLRAMFFMPYIVSTVAVGMTWLMLMNPSAGVVNQFLSLLGLADLPGWFASSYWALPALIIVAIWSGLGYAAVIYLSALQDAPTDLYEAAEVDGAGPWRRFRAITWPSLLPTTVFLLVTLFIGTSQGFGLVALLTSGGPGDSTTVLPYYMYQTGFQFYRFGYAAAIGLVTFVGVLLLTLAMWRAQRGRALHD